jgi:hypothetical protein
LFSSRKRVSPRPVNGYRTKAHPIPERNRIMSKNWIYTALVLAGGMFNCQQAAAQFPLQGSNWPGTGSRSSSGCANGTCSGNVAPMPTCPNGNCTARIWFPTPIGNPVTRAFYTDRPTYTTVSPSSARSLPLTNRESPFYEYREAPSRNVTPTRNPVRTPAASRNTESPYYP